MRRGIAQIVPIVIGDRAELTEAAALQHGKLLRLFAFRYPFSVAPLRLPDTLAVQTKGGLVTVRHLGDGANQACCGFRPRFVKKERVTQTVARTV